MTVMKKQRVQDRYYQPRGLETGRTLRHALLSAMIPTGNGAGGAGRKYIVIMWLVHHLGGLLYPLLVRREDRLQRLYLCLQRFRRQK
jgi:hypothetical protein